MDDPRWEVLHSVLQFFKHYHHTKLEADISNGCRVLEYVILGRTKVKGFQILRKKLMIFGPKNPPPGFQPSIRSKSARFKARAERKDSMNRSHCSLSAPLLTRADLL